ncbi:MAG: GNAT family N-acetyltransferase, partial [Rhizobium sp.]|nr:GNAT family N-acetyltransferase [Rhizobium sp.]
MWPDRPAALYLPWSYPPVFVRNHVCETGRPADARGDKKAAPKRRQKSERDVVVEIAGEAARRGSAGPAPLLAATAALGRRRAIVVPTAAAFAGHPHSDGSEPQIIERLRRLGKLTLSLVAEDDGKIVGHVAFSPVTLSGGEGGWYGLGPISVAPGRQRGGIGSTLIKTGLAKLEAQGASG